MIHIYILHHGTDEILHNKSDRFDVNSTTEEIEDYIRRWLGLKIDEISYLTSDRELEIVELNI